MSGEARINDENLYEKPEKRVSKRVYGSKLSKHVYGSKCVKKSVGESERLEEKRGEWRVLIEKSKGARHQDDGAQISLMQPGILLHAPSVFDVITGIDVKYPRDVHQGTRQGHGAPESRRGRARSLKEEDIISF